MEYSFSSLMVVTSFFLLVGVIMWLKSHGSRKQPPGPPGLPVLGNMFDLGTVPHQTMYELGFKHGPVLWLWLGSMNTLVVQSSMAAAEFFKNDSVYCDRKDHHVFTDHDYYKGSLVLGRYGPYWRMIRRICTTELMSNKRINESVLIRKKCIHNTIKAYRFIEDAVRNAEAKGESGEVNLSQFLFLLNFNVVGNLTFSKDLLDPECKEGHEFYKAMENFTIWAGKPNVSDFIPFLKHFDPQKVKKNMKKDMGKGIEIVSGFVKERLEEKKLGKERVRDFLDVLLEHGDENPEKITYHRIVILTLEMFLAGSETTSTTMEWFMAELLKNPEIMRKLKQELDHVIGPSNAVQESDIDKLPYLQAVIKETLRLHPPVPFLIPRNTMQDTNFMGHFIPKDTQVFVNVWAIGRDKEVWDDPLLFKPERFIGSDIEYKGQNFEFIPFGAGRRICVGLSLGHKVLHYGTASLLHHFDCELGENYTPDTLDMNDKAGLTARKLVPLKVKPKIRIIEG